MSDRQTAYDVAIAMRVRAPDHRDAYRVADAWLAFMADHVSDDEVILEHARVENVTDIAHRDNPEKGSSQW